MPTTFDTRCATFVEAGANDTSPDVSPPTDVGSPARELNELKPYSA